MIRGEIQSQSGYLELLDGTQIQLSPELAQLGNRDFTHPYYWAAFTMIGSPW
jgi:CHAT domain-containing protein